jgi:hypothetical protein
MSSSSEAECTLVSSRGLMKRCDIYSANPDSTNKYDFLHLAELANPGSQRPFMKIYVCSDVLPIFVENILDLLTVPFYLVSGDSDLSVPKEALTERQLEKLLAAPKLIRWASQNMIETPTSPRLLQIPIGLAYHCAPNPLGQEALLLHIRKSGAPLHERICKVYMNAHHRPDRHGDREAACSSIPADLLVKEPTVLPRAQVWKAFTRYAFVASPLGNGVDCHRTWEALCCGAIPIICGAHLTDLFADLPVLRVAKWSDVSAELLERTIEEFSTKTFNYRKLTLDYWMARLTAL